VEATLTTPRSDVWVYQFDPSSRLRHLNPPLGADQETVWDAQNHAISTQSQAEAQAEVATTSVYSSEETPCNLSGVTGANDGTDLCSITRPGLGTTYYEYDEGLGSTIYHLVTKQTNPDDTYITYEYDANGLAARQPSEETAHATGGAVLQTESWVYDDDGNVVSETRPDGKTTTFTYSDGLLTGINGPGATPDRSFTYDDWGNVLTETWPESVITSHYDTATRLDWSEATSTTLDDVDRVTTTYNTSNGQVEAVGNSTHEISYTYDTWGRVLTETDALGETTTFGYDAESNLISRSDSKGTTTFEVDALGRVTEVDDTGVGTTTIGYTTSGGALISTMTLPNGITATATSRAGVGDVESVEYENIGGTLGLFVRSYDTMGRVDTETGPLVNREYDYDGMGRLIEARDYDPATSALLETREYGFDVNTNRTSLIVTPEGGSPTTTTYQVASDGSDRLVSIDSGTALTYDDNGNTETMPGRTMTWNAANRLSSAAVPSGPTVAYELDPLGRILTRTTTGGSENKTAEYHYVVEADTPSWAVDDVDTVETTIRYISGEAGLLATEVVGGDIAFPLTNPHGDIWAWTNESGTITTTLNQDEYGNPLQAPTGEEGVDRYGWLGNHQREWDPEVQLTLMGVRGYDPSLGRFLSVDPIRGGSATDYDYSAGDPVNSFDLDGKARRSRKSKSGPELSDLEKQELAKKKAGQPYNKKIVNQAEQKLKSKEKFEKKRKSSGSETKRRGASFWAGVGAAAVAAWWAAKWLSPACGPFLPVCAVAL
jgi:RHS repeat-associated protein